MTDGVYVSPVPPIKHEEEKPSIFKFILQKLLVILIIALILFVIFLIPSIRKHIDTAEEEIQVMILDKSSYSYGEAGVEYEVNPARSGNIAKFDTIKVEPQYYIKLEVDGETYKVIGADLYDTYKDRIGDSVEVSIRTDYYPFIDKFKKVVTIPRAYSE